MSTDSIVVIHGATWAEYQRHVEMKSRIGRLIETWCLANSIPFDACGSWTLENEDAGRGLEPDECYVFGRVENPSAPELAIEVIWTSGGIDELAVYRKLAVREVWIWKAGRITPYALEGDEYVPIQGSRVLPDLDVDQLASFLDHPTLSDAILDYRAALRKG